MATDLNQELIKLETSIKDVGKDIKEKEAGLMNEIRGGKNQDIIGFLKESLAALRAKELALIAQQTNLQHDIASQSIQGSASAFDLNSLSNALTPVPEDREVKLLEMTMKIVEAETEGKKADLEMARLGGGKLPAKVTFKAVIKQDALGTKTKWAGKMKEGSLSGKIERTPRPDSSGEYNTVIFFTGSTANTEKMKESLMEDYKDDVVITAVVPSEQFKNVCIFKTPGEHHRTSGSSGGSETLFELDPDEYQSTTIIESLLKQLRSEGVKSESSSTSRNSSVQQKFRNSIVERDFSGNFDVAKCLLCKAGRNSDLTGAHIVPQSALITTMRTVSLSCLDDVRNGILLCKQCHGHYDDGLWDTGDDWVANISEALKVDGKYAELDNTSLNGPVGIDAPTSPILKFHTDFCAEQKVKRNAKTKEYTFTCDVCSSRWKTANGKNNHKCRGQFKKKLYSPLKDHLTAENSIEEESLAVCDCGEGKEGSDEESARKCAHARDC